MKVSICLMGGHSNRTPFSYTEYRSLLQGKFQFLDDPVNADFLVFGFLQDIKDNATKISHIKSANPDIRLVIVSEEPLWDSLWGEDFWKKHNRVKTGGFEFEYTNLNHSTSTLYEFDNFPYFLTTDNNYFIRYSHYFKRNAQFNKDKIQRIWQKAHIKAAFYLEKRAGSNYAVDYPQYGVLGLTNLRSRVAEECNITGSLNVGQGWRASPKRQLLPDWHLDKLSSLDLNSRLVSAIENTCQASYITEKIFDAYAVLGIPVYYAPETHRMNQLVNSKSFINLNALEAQHACDKLKSFTPDVEFVDCYQNTIATLNRLFSSPEQYLVERVRLVTGLVSEFEQL